MELFTVKVLMLHPDLSHLCCVCGVSPPHLLSLSLYHSISLTLAPVLSSWHPLRHRLEEGRPRRGRV